MAEFSHFEWELPLPVITVGLFAPQLAAHGVGGWIRRRFVGVPDPSADESPDMGFVARTRLAFGLAHAAKKPPLARSAEAQRASIQTATLAAVGPNASTPLTVLVVPAVNAVLDIGVEREAMLAEQAPPTVLAALAAYTLLTARVVGYALAGGQVRVSGQPAPSCSPCSHWRSL